MSMSFTTDINEENAKFIREIFKDQIVAMDKRTALFQGNLKLATMKKVVNKLNQEVEIELHSPGDIKTMADGTQYQITENGWRKIK